MCLEYFFYEIENFKNVSKNFLLYLVYCGYRLFF